MGADFYAAEVNQFQPAVSQFHFSAESGIFVPSL
jgi:hypothetical protein